MWIRFAATRRWRVAAASTHWPLNPHTLDLLCTDATAERSGKARWRCTPTRRRRVGVEEKYGALQKSIPLVFPDGLDLHPKVGRIQNRRLRADRLKQFLAASSAESSAACCAVLTWKRLPRISMNRARTLIWATICEIFEDVYIRNNLYCYSQKDLSCDRSVRYHVLALLNDRETPDAKSSEGRQTKRISLQQKTSAGSHAIQRRCDDNKLS